MSINIFDGGASVRIVRGRKTLLVTKEQIKAIDTIHDALVRIDIGEGPLRNIFLDYREVNQPEVGSAEDLRDVINQMLFQSGGGDGCAFPPEVYKLLENIAANLGALLSVQTDVARCRPTRIDESNPNLIYKGWHRYQGVPSNNEWAIQRIRRVEDCVIMEWAFGSKEKAYVWDERHNYDYLPHDHSNGGAIVC